MMEDQQRSIEFDLLDFDFGDGSGQQRLAVGFASDITNEPLDDLALNSAVLDLGEVDFVALFDLTYEAHVVFTIHTTAQERNPLVR